MIHLRKPLAAALSISLLTGSNAPAFAGVAASARSGAPVAAPGFGAVGAALPSAPLELGLPGVVGLDILALSAPGAIPSASASPDAALPRAETAFSAQPALASASPLPLEQAPLAALGAAEAQRPAASEPAAALGAAQAIQAMDSQDASARPSSVEAGALRGRTQFDGAAAALAHQGSDPVPAAAGSPAAATLSPAASADAAAAKPEPVAPGPWRPQSTRVGIGPLKYIWWNGFYAVMQAANRFFSFHWLNPIGLGRAFPVSWDLWPTPLGLLYLIAKLRYVRSNALTEPYDYKTNDTMPPTKEPAAARTGYLPDAKWALDKDNPQMGTPNTRMGSNLPAMKVKPDPWNARPSPYDAAELRRRKVDANGKDITIWARILNVLAGGWIQFQFHNFGGNTKRDPIDKDPHVIPRDPKAGWPDNVAVVDRTSKDHTRVTDDGRPTVLNEKVQAWVQGQVYGSSAEDLAKLRSFEGGKMRLDAKGMLPEDPAKPGIDLTGFNNNYNPILGFLHWLFVKEHNAIADHHRYFHPEWDDEKVFQEARKDNVALIARIHTIMWTEDLLQHPTLQTGMHADWYGLLGQKLKLWFMRLIQRRPWVGKALRWFTNNDTIWGMPGSRHEHHDGPFQVPKHFRMVYRLHEMILSDYEILDPKTDKTLDRIELLKFVQENTRPIIEKYGYEALAYSFLKKSTGHLKLNNFPGAMMGASFRNQQNGRPTNLAELDLMRERLDGTGTFNQFMRSVGEAPVKTFLELTGGDAELARAIELKYEGDIDAVDAGIGILAYPKPAGFALSFPQFYQFVLNAPRRVKSNRHLTEFFDYLHYGVGMDWIEHSGGMLGVLRRHVPGLAAHTEGVLRAFAPWLDSEHFPARQLAQVEGDAFGVFKAEVRTLALGVAAGVAALWAGLVTPWLLAAMLGALAIVPVALGAKRMLAIFFMRNVWEKANTDRRSHVFGLLYKGERWINRAAFFGWAASLATAAGAAALAWTLWPAAPFIAGLTALLALSAFAARKRSNAFASDARLLKIALRRRMRDGLTRIDSKNPRSVDMAEFENMFRRYAPGRDYMTAYDFARMREEKHWQASQAGTGNVVSRWLERLAAKRSAKDALERFSDMTVEEDRALVPAISKAELLRVYQGHAELDFLNERGPVPAAGSLPEGGFKGTNGLLKGRDTMSLQLKKDPRDENGYYATLSQYTRTLYNPAMKGSWLKKLATRFLSFLHDWLPLPERLQITNWVPRMHAYRVEHLGGLTYAMRPLRPSASGVIEPDRGAKPDILTVKKPGDMRGAVLTRYNRDGSVAETVTFTAGSGSTWEPFVPAKYFMSKDPTGGDYFHKRVNVTLSADGVMEFDTDEIKGRYDLVETAPGLYVLWPQQPGQLGAEKLAGRIGTFIDIVNWKPVFTTDEFMLINPADPTDVGFFYERH